MTTKITLHLTPAYIISMFNFFKQAEMLGSMRSVMQRYAITRDTDYLVEYLVNVNPAYNADTLHELLKAPDVVKLIDYMVDNAPIK